MDFNLSDEQELLRDTVARFIREEYSLDVRRELCELSSGNSKLMWHRYAELGLLSLCLPGDIGDFEFDFTDTVVVVEQLACGCTIEPFVENIVYAAEILKRCPTSLLRDKLLIDMADGRSTVAVAHDDESERLRGRKPVTEAAMESSGKISISGEKFMVLGASSCDRLLVTANIMGSHETALIVVDSSLPGVRFNHYSLIDDSSASDIVFEDVLVDGDSVIARGEDVEAVISTANDKLVLARMAEALGVMEASMSVTSEYVKERKQFGRSIAEFQSIQHALADMFVYVQAARSIFFHSLSKIDCPKYERERAVSSAKYLICRNGLLLTASAIQLHGGYGITDEYMVSHFYKRMVLINLLCGDSSHHLSRMAR